MASTSETGHAKNVANFDELISFTIGYGADYNPSKASIQSPALQTLAGDAKNVIKQVNSAFSAYSNAVGKREIAFDPLSQLTTRVLNSLKSTDASQQLEESAQSLVRKIQGRRATPKKTDEEKLIAASLGNSTKEISSSQMSYDSRLDNFDKLIKLSESIPEYAPNEEELKLTSLSALYDSLIANNSGVVNASTALSNACIARNNLLYAKETGLVDIAMDTKTYIKSVYGATSPQYKQVSGIAFKSEKI